MPVIKCTCGRSYRIQDGLAGKTFRCKICNTKLVVPADGAKSATTGRQVQQLQPVEIDKTLIAGSDTWAGNPALLKFSPVRFLKCQPLLVAIGIVGGLFLAGFVFRETGSIPIALGGFVVGIGFGFQSMYVKYTKKFRAGNLVAAVVINTRPWRIAVFTDLANDGGGPKYAVGVCRQNLDNMFPAPPKKGAKLVTVCWYVGEVGTGAYEDVHPTVINTGCTDQKQLDRAMASVEADDFEILASVAPKLETDRNGLYKLWELPELAAVAGVA